MRETTKISYIEFPIPIYFKNWKNGLALLLFIRFKLKYYSSVITLFWFFLIFSQMCSSFIASSFLVMENWSTYNKLYFWIISASILLRLKRKKEFCELWGLGKCPIVRRGMEVEIRKEGILLHNANYVKK